MRKQEQLFDEQLDKVIYADLSNYDETTKTYFIPKINKIKLKINHSYIIKIKETIKSNDILRNNYNKGREPEIAYYLIDVISILNKVIKVNAIVYNIENNITENKFWSGYLSIKDIEIIKEC